MRLKKKGSTLKKQNKQKHIVGSHLRGSDSDLGECQFTAIS